MNRHLWMSSRLYSMIIDYRQSEGWKWVDASLSINPTIYLEQFLDGFKDPIWNWEQLETPQFFVVQKYR